MTTKSHDRKEGQTALTFSLSDQLKQRIEAAAAHDRRSKSNWITLTLEQVLDELERAHNSTKSEESPSSPDPAERAAGAKRSGKKKS